MAICPPSLCWIIPLAPSVTEPGVDRTKQDNRKK